MIVVLSEAEFRDKYSVNGRELHRLTNMAQLLGCRIIPLPDDLSVYGDVEDVFAYAPDDASAGLWIGYIPTRVSKARRKRDVNEDRWGQE